MMDNEELVRPENISRREQLIRDNEEFAAALANQFIRPYGRLDEYTRERWHGIALLEMIRSVDRHLANPRTIPLKAAICANIRQRLVEAASARQQRRRLCTSARLRIAAEELRCTLPRPDQIIFSRPKLPQLRPENKEQLIELAKRNVPSSFVKANWLEGLTEKQREVMLLSYVLVLDLTAIARILGVSLSAVSQRHDAALPSVKKYYLKYLGREP